MLWVPHGEQSVGCRSPKVGGRRSHSCTASLPAGPSITLDTACSSSLLALQGLGPPGESVPWPSWGAQTSC